MKTGKNKYRCPRCRHIMFERNGFVICSQGCMSHYVKPDRLKEYMEIEASLEKLYGEGNLILNY